MMYGLAVVVKGVLAGVPWGLATAFYAWLMREELISAIREEGLLRAFRIGEPSSSSLLISA